MARVWSVRYPAAAVVVILIALLGVGRLVGGDAAPASAAAPAQQVGMRVLLITDNNTDPANASDVAYGDWVNTLKREGVPYDTWVTSAPMPALSSSGAGGTQVANYEGVVVATSGLEGMTAAQWTALQSFEHQFSVRQVTAYASPSSDQGLNPPSATNVLGSTTPISLTSDGVPVFPYLKGVALDAGSFGYEATAAAGANVEPLITGPNSSVVVGIYTSPDGRQTMFQTFNENPTMLQSQLLRHGELDWLARNTYFGDQRNYLETHIDDNFLSDDAWSIAGNATTAPHTTDYNAADSLRTVPADVTAAAAWSQQNNFRIDMLFNGGGSVAVASGDSLVGAGDSGSGAVGSTGTTGGSGTCSSASPCPDPLLAAYLATDTVTGRPYTGDFAWISHTWDHPNVDQGCANQNYIEAELNQNTAWATKAAAATAGDPINGGLGLTSSIDPAAALGADDPQVVITGEHSGVANLLPGNPGQVDPPSLDEAAAATTAGTLATGTYVYAVTDQFNTAPPGQTPTVGTGESAASTSAPVTLTAPGEVTLSWSAVCHAGRYNVYRAPYSGTAPGAWSLIGTVTANTTTDFISPSGNSTTSTAGGGAAAKVFTDTGVAGTATGSTGALSATTKPSTEGTAVESPYEQNPVLDAAFAAASGGGIKYFGADASKPYPNPADGTFGTGTYSGAEYAAGTSFTDAGATGIPRYPTNVYYNVSTNAQEIDEYETLYDSPTCTPVAGVTTCNPAGTTFTIGQIMASVDQGMFQHMMGNDPKPTYFHQTNLMSQPTGTVNGVGNGLYYEAMNPLLAQYHQYFQANAPIVQLTMPQIGALLNQQSAWAAADTSQIKGSISGSVVTVTNSGAATEIPLTGTTVGSAYAGTQSGWVSAPQGTSTYPASAAWPAAPTTAVVIQVPAGSAPSSGPTGLPGAAKPPATPGGAPHAAPVGSQCIQVPPTTVALARGSKATAYLKCKAALGSLFVRGTLSATIKGQTVRKSFRIATRKIGRVSFTLPKHARAAASGHTHPTLRAKLKIAAKQAHGRDLIARGTLNIRTAPKKHAKKTKAKPKKHIAATHK